MKGVEKGRRDTQGEVRVKDTKDWDEEKEKDVEGKDKRKRKKKWEKEGEFVEE